MKKLSLLILLVLACGCTKHARFYVVEGPLVEQNVGVIQARFVHNPFSPGGPIELTMPDGEVCKGEYTTLYGGGTSVGTGFGTGSVFGANAWATQWGIASGSSYTNWGSATMLGNRGTVIQMEYLTGRKGCGLAKDNKGNLYKVHF